MKHLAVFMLCRLPPLCLIPSYQQLVASLQNSRVFNSQLPLASVTNSSTPRGRGGHNREGLGGCQSFPCGI